MKNKLFLGFFLSSSLLICSTNNKVHQEILALRKRIESIKQQGGLDHSPLLSAAKKGTEIVLDQQACPYNRELIRTSIDFSRIPLLLVECCEKIDPTDYCVPCKYGAAKLHLKVVEKHLDSIRPTEVMKRD
ncbi:MAG: hypothetical protein ACXWL2_03550 [Candidatus Chromulinivorax sp.]